MKLLKIYYLLRDIFLVFIFFKGIEFMFVVKKILIMLDKEEFWKFVLVIFDFLFGVGLI